MTIRKILIQTALLSLFLINYNVLSDEIQFLSSNIKLKNDGNLLQAYNSDTKIPTKKIEIKSDKVDYLKADKILFLKNNVIFQDNKKDLIIKSDDIKYEYKKDLIYSKGYTEIEINNYYKIKSNDIFYNREINIIYGDRNTIIEDGEKNIYELIDKFSFDLNNEIIKSKNSEVTDNNGNKYKFEDLIINIKKKEIVGKEITVDFINSYFGNKNNDPVLEGRGGYSNEKELKLYKAAFSTCNIVDKDCRGWELISEEFKHNKTKKLFEYKNSWLKIFNQKIFYLPYFSHPDPSVNRKSGFLTPSYTASDSLGTSVILPYFKILDRDKDVTFSPRIYSEKNFLLQNEYRQALENSKIVTDMSFLIGNEGTKGHFFYNQIGKFNDKTNYKFNLNDVKGDNYLKKHKLIETSSLIKNDSLLLSNFDINWDFSSSNLFTSFKMYQDLTRGYSDRYQYIYPDFRFIKRIDIPKNYNGKFDFSSYGFNKNYNTNVNETVLTNDFLFSSNEYVSSNGFSTNYELLLKNSNSYSNNSSILEENTNYNLYSTLKIDTSLPLKKNFDEYTNYLKPVISFRYSPNGNKNISDKDISLNYDSAFSLNRIGTSHQVEGGEAVSLGLEFKKNYLDGSNILDFKIANVLRRKADASLPKKSKLNKTRSDIFGSLDYNIKENIKLGYYFSYNKDLDYSNLDQINFDFGINNFFSNISYYIEHNDLDKVENVKNKSSYIFNKENKFSFEISKDLEDDFTQYYNLIYTYKTDCISINLNYNNTFSRDGSLEPNKSLAFLLKIIPFTELGVPNLNMN
tara:strand:+ start:1360 stop:3750 length:2391 start_codon:yes stop_codon:yes gene_type:complete